MGDATEEYSQPKNIPKEKMLSENADLAELNTSKKGMLFPIWGKKNKKKNCWKL